MPQLRSSLRAGVLFTALIAAMLMSPSGARASSVALTYMVGSAYGMDFVPWMVSNGNYYQFPFGGSDQRFVGFTVDDSPLRTEVSSGYYAPTITTHFAVDLGSIHSDFSPYLPAPAGYADASELMPSWAELTLTEVYPRWAAGGLVQFSFNARWRSDDWAYALSLFAEAPMRLVGPDERINPVTFVNPYDGYSRQLTGSETSGSIANDSYVGGERWNFNSLTLWSKQTVSPAQVPLPGSLVLVGIGLALMRPRNS